MAISSELRSKPTDLPELQFFEFPHEDYPNIHSLQPISTSPYSNLSESSCVVVTKSSLFYLTRSGHDQSFQCRALDHISKYLDREHETFRCCHAFIPTCARHEHLMILALAMTNERDQTSRLLVFTNCLDENQSQLPEELSIPFDPIQLNYIFHHGPGAGQGSYEGFVVTGRQTGLRLWIYNGSETREASLCVMSSNQMLVDFPEFRSLRSTAVLSCAFLWVQDKRYSVLSCVNGYVQVACVDDHQDPASVVVLHSKTFDGPIASLELYIDDPSHVSTTTTPAKILQWNVLVNECIGYSTLFRNVMHNNTTWNDEDRQVIDCRGQEAVVSSMVLDASGEELVVILGTFDQHIHAMVRKNDVWTRQWSKQVTGSVLQLVPFEQDCLVVVTAAGLQVFRLPRDLIQTRLDDIHGLLFARSTDKGHQLHTTQGI